MTTNDTFERRLGTWLEEDSAHRVPDHLDASSCGPSRPASGPAWSSLERWLPMIDTVARPHDGPRPARRCASPSLAALLLALVGGALLDRRGPATRRPVRSGLAENGRIFVVDGTHR